MGRYLKIWQGFLLMNWEKDSMIAVWRHDKHENDKQQELKH